MILKCIINIAKDCNIMTYTKKLRLLFCDILLKLKVGGTFNQFSAVCTDFEFRTWNHRVNDD